MAVSFIKQFVVVIGPLQFWLQAIGNVVFDKACLLLHWGGSSSCAKFKNIFEFFYNFVMSDAHSWPRNRWGVWTPSI